jgi:isoquinoline 1-oxidoreductase
MNRGGTTLEPERYELGAISPGRLNRRQFFRNLGLGVLVVFASPSLVAQESGNRRRGRGPQLPADVSAWIHIGEDNSITAFTGKAEVGQNIRTSLTQAVAEELRTPVAAIRLIMADTELTPWDMGTFGSQSTPQMASRLHRVAAAAREALLDLAAEHFKADRATLVVGDGQVKSGADAVTFGQLTKGQKLVKTVDDSAPVTPAADWKIAGTSVPKVNGRDFVSGRHKYASDINRPGMLHGKILRPATFEASVSSLDTKEAEAMPGVTVVHDGNFIGVAAPDVLQAEHALDAIHIEWKPPADEQPSNKTIFDYLKKGAGNGGRDRQGDSDAVGNGAAQTVAADHTLNETYTIAYIAHTPLEPRAAVAEWNDDKLTVWTGSQRPFGVRSDLAQALGIPEERVHVIVPDTGSGYGGKHTSEAALEAARLAKAAGKPVKLVWTRQEEFTWAYLRPAGVIEITSGVSKEGNIASWEFHNYNSGNSGIRSPYETPVRKEEFHQARSPLKQGSYRALASTANNFARESHVDQLASLVKMDPLEFRLKNLKDERLRAVLQEAAKAFGWGKEKPTGTRGFGIACGTEKGSYLATCVEVLADQNSGSVKVVRATTAFDCGAVVNPNHLKNQIEGAMMMGLGGALFEAIEFEKGMITNARLSDYRVPRFSDLPKMEVILVDRKDVRSAGAGETPIIGIAPAVGNAIFAATNVRLRSMPMAPDGLKS